AADVRPGQPEVVAQDVDEQPPWLDAEVVWLPVDGQPQVDQAGHQASSPPSWSRAQAAWSASARSGSSFSVSRSGQSASSTAATMAGSAPIVPPSPAPLIPSG